MKKIVISVRISEDLWNKIRALQGNRTITDTVVDLLYRAVEQDMKETGLFIRKLQNIPSLSDISRVIDMRFTLLADFFFIDRTKAERFKQALEVLKE